MTEQLSDTVTVGGLPGSVVAKIAPVPGQVVQVVTDPAREYAAGSPLNWYQNLPHALPWTLDDLTRDFGSDLYERMMNDAQVRASVNVLKASVLEEGPQLRSPIEKRDDPDYQRAADILQAAERMLDELQTPLEDVLWEMADAMPLGNRVAEQTFATETTYTGRQQLQIVRLAVKPRESISFVVDAYMNLLGILARVPGQPLGVQQGMLLTDFEHVPNILPRSKFAVLSFRPRNGDPRGTSVLRAAFDPWNQKQQLKREFLKYLTQFGSPSLIGFTAPDAESIQAQNTDGTLKVDGNGYPIMQTPEEAMVTALQQFANGTATAFPNGSSVDPIEMKGDGKPFLDAFAFLDLQIVKAILHQSLATEDSQHQSKAASGTHKDILDSVARQAKRPIERMLHRDVLRTWVRLNYGEDAIRLTPCVSLGLTETEDMPAMWTAAAQMFRSGAIAQSQLGSFYKLLGIDPPDEGDLPRPYIQEQIRVTADGSLVPLPGNNGQPSPGLPAKGDGSQQPPNPGTPPKEQTNGNQTGS